MKIKLKSHQATAIYHMLNYKTEIGINPYVQHYSVYARQGEIAQFLKVRKKHIPSNTLRYKMNRFVYKIDKYFIHNRLDRDNK